MEYKYIELKSSHFSTLPQYHFERDKMVNAFNEYAPLFMDYMWYHGSDFHTESFHCFRYEDEFYLVHKNSGTMINWYKHLGRTNTCNKPLTIEDLQELLTLLNDDILYETDYNAWCKIHVIE